MCSARPESSRSRACRTTGWNSKAESLPAGVTLPPFGPGFVAALPGVRRGFSGGPVLDAQGHLVGMIAALRPGAQNDAVAASGFAPQRQRLAGGTEAFILGAAEIRSEVRRLLD
jgi:hypothetical protein